MVTEAEYLCRQIEKLNNTAIVIDTGVVGTPTSEADITRQQVAQAGGTSLKTLLENPTREVAAPIMADGTTHLVIDLVTQGKVNGIISMGGTQGTTLATKVMRALPYGFPKVMVSTMASGNIAHWVGIKDITMMFSVTDILGLNPVMRKMLANAAASICGMANVDVELKQGDRPLVAVTTVGITTKGAMKAVEVLEAAGYETIVFHAVGSGGRAMEQMMKEGLIGGVLDYAIIEVSNEMHNALLAGGIERLTTAGKLGIPQVICPGAIEVLVFNEPETVPAKYKNRTLIPHSPQITAVRLNAAEMSEFWREVARLINHTKIEAVFMNPIGGYDSYAVEGMGFYDPEADAAFMAELKANLTSTFRVIDRDTHIEDVAFATEASELLISLIEKNSRNML